MITAIYNSGGNIQNKRKIKIENLLSNQIESWYNVTRPLNDIFSSITASAIKDKIYVTGVTNPGGLHVHECYDPVTDTWVSKSIPSTGKVGSVTAVVSDKIYMFGGSTYDRNEYYDPDTDSWSVKANFPYSDGLLSSVAINGKIYLLSIKSHYCYDPVTDSWSIKTSMPTARASFAFSEANGKMYIIGGSWNSTRINTNECYDPVTDSWSTKAPMPTVRDHLAACTMNDKIYALGGSGTVGSDSRKNECYDPATGSWSIKVASLNGRWNFSAVSVNNKIYSFFFNSADCYQPNVPLKSFPITGSSIAQFNKKVKCNNIEKSANSEFSTEEFSVISFIENEVSGTITEKIEKEIVINNL